MLHAWPLIAQWLGIVGTRADKSVEDMCSYVTYIAHGKRMKRFIIVNVWLLTFEPILLLQVHHTICIFLSLCAPHYSLN